MPRQKDFSRPLLLTGVLGGSILRRVWGRLGPTLRGQGIGTKACGVPWEALLQVPNLIMSLGTS